MTDLALLKQAAEQATPGPWTVDEANGDIVAGHVNVAITYACRPEDKTAIVAAVNALPDLLAQLEAQTARADAAEAERDEIKASMTYRHSLIGRTEARALAAEQRASTAFAGGMEAAARIAATCEITVPLAPGCPSGASSASRQIAAAIRQAASEPRQGEE